MVPRILAVLHVPKALDDRLSEGPDQVLLRHRAYWRSLLGEVEINAAKPEDWQEKKLPCAFREPTCSTPRDLT
jgi:hypothetical protein